MVAITNKNISQYESLPFQDYMQSIDIFNQTSLEYREKLVEFCMHNFTLIDMNLWGPNSRLGDMKLITLASWLNHEKG